MRGRGGVSRTESQSATVFTGDAMIDDNWTTAHIPGWIIGLGFKGLKTQAKKLTFATEHYQRTVLTVHAVTFKG